VAAKPGECQTKAEERVFGMTMLDENDLLEEVTALRALVVKHMQAIVLDMFEQAGDQGVTWEEGSDAVSDKPKGAMHARWSWRLPADDD
jgi:hypothetical protein